MACRRFRFHSPVILDSASAVPRTRQGRSIAVIYERLSRSRSVGRRITGSSSLRGDVIRLGLLGPASDDENERERTDAHFVARLERRGPRDAYVADERAVLAAEIFDRRMGAIDDDTSVTARDFGRI